MSTVVPSIAILSGTGIAVWSSTDGRPEGGSYSPISEFIPETSKSCKTMKFSPQGKYFGWTNGQSVKVCSTKDWSVVTTIVRHKVQDIQFSPKDTYIVTYEMYAITKENPHGLPNLNVFEAATGKLVLSFVQKKQIGWEPEWSDDQSLFGLMIGGEGLLYEVNSDGSNSWTSKPSRKFGSGRNGKISVAPGPSPVHIAYYVPGSQGQPSTCRIFQYPNVDNNQPTASKSFFQADRVEFMWNNKGTNLLLLTTTDVDQSGASYYGKQALHYMGVRGPTANVQLSKEGPIHAVAWSPKNIEFCIVYGFMPAKATLFNLKCEPVFEFGTGPRNSIYYNIPGNLLILAGFGNLRGRVEVWDTLSRKLVSTLDAPDTTLLEWGPTGEVFVTATTAPRLKMSNGFKVWHYSGSLLHETAWPAAEALLGVCWQVYPKGIFKEFVIKPGKIQGIEPSQPQASRQAYRPPSARGKDIKFKLHDDDEPAGQPGKTIVNNPSKATLKQKKKREAKRAKKITEEIEDEKAVSSPALSPFKQSSSTKFQTTNNSELTGDPELDKKIKNIKKKLEAIAKLKLQKAEGKTLEVNQIAKISTEKDLLKELSDLKI